MPKTISWHAKSDTVYHDNSKCQRAAEVQATKRVIGTAEKPKCAECEQLDLDGK